MDVKSLIASGAYKEALTRSMTKGLADSGTTGGVSGGSFSDMLQQVGKDVVETVQKAEKISIDAATNQAELIDVVTAVTNAELALESVIAVRDRVVQAYQEIIRMPI